MVYGIENVYSFVRLVRSNSPLASIPSPRSDFLIGMGATCIVLDSLLQPNSSYQNIILAVITTPRQAHSLRLGSINYIMPLVTICLNLCRISHYT
jgi:hypothetical protein